MYFAEDFGPWAELLTSAATVLLVAVAWVQLASLRATSRADFVHKLNGDFFNPQMRKIVQLLQDHTAVFDDNGGKPRYIEDGTELFSCYELDDQLLGPLENVGIFECIGAVELSSVYDVFGYYILMVWEHVEIQRYIEWQRKQPYSWDVYERLEMLHQRCEAFRTKKEYYDAIWLCETQA
jgi:hypothetical protein